ncbi:cell division protein FtsL [Permianibacter aggregans]|uniref:Cell division protein FtsL n=1 Tax=Permianibacter aggregans TaxID=1510150 RepID=A0A4R6UN32_9GAMM|nr:cell division protein FtsL [Permianibacter aggregans]QGX39037.1 cell division protein FtsL [Permianibacter aggregans]TDQ44624.1 cell division protein FtsL [Permianibacter aggregans]
MSARRPTPSLVRLILASVKSVGFGVLVLALLTFSSAVLVVWSAHETRMARAELEKLERQRDELDNDYRELKLAQAALAEHSRVDVIAKQKLDMERVSAENEKVVQHD